ncbi:peptidase M36, partial [Atractiella rhizophila]
YKVFPWSVNDPTEGGRQLLSRHQKPAYLSSSSSDVKQDTIGRGGEDAVFRDTRGNNVFAQDNPSGGFTFENNFRPLVFDFPLGWKKGGSTLDPATYINASVSELFYTINEIHDLFWRYGFDEPAGNFQERNFGRGGLGNDAVQANAQDGSGTNNANFATPPDGQRGRMRMYVWTGSQPYRDGDLEAGIVMHEYAHGISTRLTGGPANSGCLGWGEAGGMGEGWGDAFATLIRMQSANETEYGMGDWASGRAGGIRKYRYSRNMTVNPETYKVLDGPGYWGVHAIGEVWAEMLYEVAELLIPKHGFSKTLFPPALAHNASFSDHGNSLMIRLIVDGMKLQPCRPSFMNARDAILEADKVLTGGENACEIWTGFSKRGLGPDARLVGGEFVEIICWI